MSRSGSDLFIVDNSDSDWKVHRYLFDWCKLSKAIDVATGFFEVGGLLPLHLRRLPQSQLPFALRRVSQNRLPARSLDREPGTFPRALPSRRRTHRPAPAGIARARPTPQRIYLGSTRALACRFRRPRRKHSPAHRNVRSLTKPSRQSCGVIVREGACAPPIVNRVAWVNDTVWIDAAACKKGATQAPGSIGFQGVPEAVWNSHIGGYQVCHKWLKDRKGRTLSAEDIAHYHKIVIALTETIRLTAEIDQVIETHGGWPGAFATSGCDAPSPEPSTSGTAPS